MTQISKLETYHTGRNIEFPNGYILAEVFVNTIDKNVHLHFILPKFVQNAILKDLLPYDQSREDPKFTVDCLMPPSIMMTSKFCGPPEFKDWEAVHGSNVLIEGKIVLLLNDTKTHNDGLEYNVGVYCLNATAITDF